MKLCTLELEQRPLKGKRLPGPQALHDLQTFFLQQSPLAEIDATGLIFGNHRRARRTKTDTEQKPSPGKQIQIADRVSQRNRVAQRGEIHGGAELRALGLHGNRSQRCQCLETRSGQQAVAQPDGVEAHLLGLDGQIDHARDVGAAVGGPHDGIARGNQISKQGFVAHGILIEY